MGRIVVSVELSNVNKNAKTIRIDALVDTGATYLTLPKAWRNRFGSFSSEKSIELQTVNQEVIRGDICGPVQITVEGFRTIYNEVLFLDMRPEGGEYEPLLGYIALEQCGAAVDMLGHRLLPVKYMDLK